MRRAYGCFLIVLTLVAAGCAENSGGRTAANESEQRLAGGKSAGAPLFDDLGDYHYPVTTNSPLAQRYFDQGLILTYAFNHPEAIRSFEEAAAPGPALRNGVVGRRAQLRAEHQQADGQE